MTESWQYETLRSHLPLSPSDASCIMDTSHIVEKKIPINKTNTKRLKNAALAIGISGLCIAVTLATLFLMANTLVWPLPIGDRLPFVPLRPPSFITAPYADPVPQQLIYGGKVAILGLVLLLQIVFNAILIYSTVTNSRSLMLPWLLLQPLTMLMMAVYTGTLIWTVAFAKRDTILHIILILALISTVVFAFLSWLLVLRLFLRLRTEAAQQMRRFRLNLAHLRALEVNNDYYNTIRSANKYNDYYESHFYPGEKHEDSQTYQSYALEMSLSDESESNETSRERL